MPYMMSEYTGRGRRAVAEALESRFHLAATLPDGFEETLVVTGLDTPTTQVFAPDGRLFVAEKAGKIRIVHDGELHETPFLTVPVDTFFENGIHGMALDPNFETNGYLYVYYTRQDAGSIRQRLSRFTASTDNPDLADPASEAVLLDNITQTATAHQGGGMHFGADGMLYLPTGDAGTSANAQDLTSLMGKILRLNVANYPNSIVPADNPVFPGAPPNARPEIYAYGFRNPFTAGIKPGTSTVYANDVGELDWEEINVVQPGKNYGWPSAEGMSNIPSFTNPIYAYGHGEFGAAITGGAFYTGAQFPAVYHGQYFFADYVQGFIRTLDPDNGNAVTNFATGAQFPLDFDIAPDGSLYYLSGSVYDLEREFPDSSIYKITYVGDANRAPNAVAAAAPTSGLQPLTVQFSGDGSTDPDGDTLTYHWDFGDGTTGQGKNVSHTYTTAIGTFNIVLTVLDGRGGEDQAEPITITLGNRAPVATFTSPAVNAPYSGGDTISFAANATDLDEGTLPASAFQWSVVFHHNTHTHPFIQSIPGVKSGTFQIPRTGEKADDVFYRIHLTVTDSQGLQHQSFRDVIPRKATVTVASNYTGLKINLDGQPKSAPLSFVGVVGITRLLDAPLTQTLDGKTYEFVSWSDGGSASHAINTPAANTTYTAIYREVFGTGAVVAVTPVADAWVRDGTFSSDNNGFDTTLITKKSSTGFNRETYLKFNLSEIAAASITSVKLRLFARLQDDRSTSAGLGVYSVTDTSWTEGGLLWSNRPASGTTPLASVVVPDKLAQWFELDVTNFVKQQREAGATFVTLALKNTTSVVPFTVVNAREAGINRPELLITRTVTDPDPDPDPETNITLSPSADAYVRDGASASTNFGTGAELHTKSSSTGFNRDSLMKFDLTSMGDISDATLRLFGKLSQAATGVAVAVYGSSNVGWTEAGVTWNTRPVSNTGIIAQQTVASTTGEWYEFDLTSYFQQQQAAGATAVTLILKNIGGNSSYTAFNSREAAANPPELLITHQVENTDTIAPTVTGVQINPGAVSAQRSNVWAIRVQFDDAMNIADRIADGTIDEHVWLYDLTTPQSPVDRLTADRFVWDGVAFTLTIDLTIDGPGGGNISRLAEGRYELRMNTAGLTDAAGNPLAEPGGLPTGTIAIDRSTGAVSPDFFSLRGDLDGDADVDLSDLSTLSAFYGTTDSRGDCDGDGDVDLSDLSVLSTNYGGSLGS